MSHAICLYLSIILSLFLIRDVVTQCTVTLPTLQLSPQQYNGSWFVIARRAPLSKTFLPPGVNSSLIRLDVIDDKTMNMTEYHAINETCMPPLHGVLTKNDEGYGMELRTATGQLFQMTIRAIFHAYSGEQNEEMNMVVYGCNVRDRYGGCVQGEELLMVMSNSRHPQTMPLFKSAKLIEDSVCIDILQFRSLNTYNDCGDEIVDEDQKLKHAHIDENNEFVDVECRVENLKPKQTNISTFFDEPRVLTVIAYIDRALSGQQIAHISCNYSTKTNAICEWTRQNTCFKTNLTTTLRDGIVTTVTDYPRLHGNDSVLDLSGTILWENGDEYISLSCQLVDDDGGCDEYRVYVWSDEEYMDRPTIREIYRHLQAVCVDPTDLVFLNTFHECSQPIVPEESKDEAECGVPKDWQPLSMTMLQGVWYVAADMNAEPKVFLQSTVFKLTPNENDSSILDLSYFAQKESDFECVGPRNGSLKLLPNSTLEVVLEYTYTFMPKFKSTMKFFYQVLYLDNQRAALYWCYRRAENGSCIQHDINILVRTRHLTNNDLSLMLPYMENVCINKDNLRWMDLHSQCGAEMTMSIKLRRDVVTLSHYDVLHILTHVQEPRCQWNNLIGVRADLYSLERAGTWFLKARYDEMAMDTYAMVGRIFAVTNTSAVLRLFQSAALPGDPLDCFTRVFTVQEKQNGDDFYYELLFESTTKNVTTMIFRFLFFNRHVGVLYSCLGHTAEGRCDERAIYVISRHETIDNAELAVLELVAKEICVEPHVLYHTATHDECVCDASWLKPMACSLVTVATSIAEWETLQNEKILAAYGTNTYYAVASSKMYPNACALRFDGNTFHRITEESTGCLLTPITVEVSVRNRLLFRVGDDEILLLHPSGRRSDLLLKEAQLAGRLPCLNRVPEEATVNATCQLLTPPQCKSSTPLQAAEKLLGDWILYASEPFYALSMKCTVTEHDDDKQIFTCIGESWRGECDREEKAILSVDAWGGITFTNPTDHTPIRVPSELPASGNVSVSDSRLVFFFDGDLVGRRYSVWLRPGASFDETIARDVAEFCVWPLATQIRGMEQNCGN